MHQVAFIYNDHAFYPIGNTPAVNLLSYHAPGTRDSDKPCELLLLACGDVRNIIYSLWCEDRPGVDQFNFTCCDIEPAILARNIIILSLMLDNAPAYKAEEFSLSNAWATTIWNLQYHLEVPKNDIKVLREQAAKLLLWTASVDEWAASPYSCIQFVSLQSIREVRKIWARYAEVRGKEDQDSFEATRRDEIAHVYKQNWSKPGMNTTFAGGVHFDPGLQQANVAFRSYWKTGVVAGGNADLKALENSNGQINPMFTISSLGDSFKMHAGTSPIASFHLADIFDRDMNDGERLEALALAAKMQFYQWSRAFVNHAKQRALSIRMYLGDAINFCHALSARNSAIISSALLTRLYTSPWQADPLLLDGPGAEHLPYTFDVIDCSNLSDFVGLLNLLPATTRLLSRRATSILYTEALRLSDDSPHKDLAVALYMDLGLASILFGITPVGSLLSYSTENLFPENLTHTLAQIYGASIFTGRRRYRMRISWRFAAGGDEYARATVLRPEYDHRVKFDANELSELIFRLYMNLFHHEDLDAIKSEYPDGQILFQDHMFSRYTRLSLVTVLQAMKNNVVTDWKKFFPLLSSKIFEDTTLTYGMEGSTELMQRLHESGIWEEERDSFPLRTTIDEMLERDMEVEFLTLTVPRSALKMIQKQDAGTPGFHLAITEKYRDTEITSRWFAIDCSFGKVVQSPNTTKPLRVVEDPQGWRGSADLIITCPLPLAVLKYSKPSKCSIGLGITFNVSTIGLMSILGPDMLLYNTKRNDKKHVLRSRTPPNVSVDHPAASKPVAADLVAEPTSATRSSGSIDISVSHVKGETSLKGTYSMTAESLEGIALRSGAAINLTGESPCSILLKIGPKEQYRMIFPHPIDSAKAKTRIARKSLWIEVTVPLSLFPSHSAGYGVNPFPIGRDGAQPYAWAIPRFNLSKQPPVTPGPWVDEVWTQFMSEREIKIADKVQKMRSKNATYLDLLIQMKMSIAQMFSHVTGFYNNSKASNFTPMKVVALTDEQLPPTTPPEILIFGSCVRHTREEGGLVLDAYVVEPGRPEARVAMARSMMELRPPLYQCSAAELALWKRFLPAAVESCRRDWMHSPSCVFHRDASLGPPLVLPEYILCDCGLGKDVDGFPFEEGQSSLAGFRDVATRVAIPMLSSVSYVEPMKPQLDVVKSSNVEAQMSSQGVAFDEDDELEDDSEWEDEE